MTGLAALALLALGADPPLAERYGGDPLFAAFEAYRRTVTVFDGPRCLHRPSCGMYAMQALHRHGLWLGGWLAVERSWRGGESSALRLLPRSGEGYFLDPLENATWWRWREAGSESATPTATPTATATPTPTSTSAPTATEATSVLAFANHLASSGEHAQAVVEYERFLFLAAGDPRAGEVELRAARSLEGAGRPDAARRRLQRLQHGTDLPARDAALFEEGLLEYRAGRHALAASHLARYAALPSPAGPGRGRALVGQGLADLRLEDGAPAARRAFEAAAAESALAPSSAALLASLREVEEAPRKSPLAAGLLSLVPGAGHLYLEEPGVAAAAFLWNGVFLWATVEAFRQRRPGLGTALASVESIFYGGALLGAVSGAHRYNRDSRALAADAVERRFGWALELGPIPGGAAAGLRGGL